MVRPHADLEDPAGAGLYAKDWNNNAPALVLRFQRGGGGRGAPAGGVLGCSTLHLIISELYATLSGWVHGGPIGQTHTQTHTNKQVQMKTRQRRGITGHMYNHSSMQEISTIKLELGF